MKNVLQDHQISDDISTKSERTLVLNDEGIFPVGNQRQVNLYTKGKIQNMDKRIDSTIASVYRGDTKGVDWPIPLTFSNLKINTFPNIQVSDGSLITGSTTNDFQAKVFNNNNAPLQIQINLLFIVKNLLTEESTLNVNICRSLTEGDSVGTIGDTVEYKIPGNSGTTMQYNTSLFTVAANTVEYFFIQAKTDKASQVGDSLQFHMSTIGGGTAPIDAPTRPEVEGAYQNRFTGFGNTPKPIPTNDFFTVLPKGEWIGDATMANSPVPGNVNTKVWMSNTIDLSQGGPRIAVTSDNRMFRSTRTSGAVDLPWVEIKETAPQPQIYNYGLSSADLGINLNSYSTSGANFIDSTLDIVKKMNLHSSYGSVFREGINQTSYETSLREYFYNKKDFNPLPQNMFIEIKNVRYYNDSLSDLDCDLELSHPEGHNYKILIRSRNLIGTGPKILIINSAGELYNISVIEGARPPQIPGGVTVKLTRNLTYGDTVRVKLTNNIELKGTYFNTEVYAGVPHGDAFSCYCMTLSVVDRSQMLYRLNSYYWNVKTHLLGVLEFSDIIVSRKAD